MNFEMYVVPGVITVMTVFMLVLGVTAWISRDPPPVPRHKRPGR